MKRGKILLLNNAFLQNGNFPQFIASLVYLREWVVHFSAKPKNEPHLPLFASEASKKKKDFTPFHV
jgi:hypothetical protein